jgi:hypothetical protein
MEIAWFVYQNIGIDPETANESSPVFRNSIKNVKKIIRVFLYSVYKVYTNNTGSFASMLVYIFENILQFIVCVER